MKVEELVSIIDSDFYTGVPDSQLKALCNYLVDKYGIDPVHHVIAANEGNCIGLAAGYHLATGKTAAVYMQNSGEGNAINPLASLTNEKVYNIPSVLIIGWRGEPGVHDEPQHVYQGEITLKLLETMGISYSVIAPETTAEDAEATMKEFRKQLKNGKTVAFVVKKGALTYSGKVDYSNSEVLKREEIIEEIPKHSGECPIVSTTGKASRELFELREKRGEGHNLDFLTVGSMGHSSSIAMAIAAQKPQKKIICIDGDGAVLMHMGALAVNGSSCVNNLIHIVINNGAHETVGGMPTVAGKVDLIKIAGGCGYINTVSVSKLDELGEAIDKALESNELSFIEVKCAIGAREDLGRPTTTPQENKLAFMNELSK